MLPGIPCTIDTHGRNKTTKMDKGDVAHGIQSTTDIVLYGTGVDIVNGPLIMISREGYKFKNMIDNTGRLVSQRIE